MRHPIACIALLLTVGAVLTLPAESRSRSHVRNWKAAVKDCTRINGRWGYYGNLWCSPAEQQQWDRATSGR